MASINNLKLLGNRVLIKPHEAEQSVNGLLLPEESRDNSQTGVVVAIGDGYLGPDKNWSFRVKESDTVIFPKYDLGELVLDGIKYVLIGENELIAIKE